MGREGIEDTLVILVEPVHLLLKHHLTDNRRLVDRTERERLELQEASALGLFGRNDQQGVLCADTEASLQIDTGLVGDGHPRMQSGGSPFHADLVRTLMHAQVTPHPMTGTMQVVIPCFPQVFPCHRIELRTTGTLREPEQLQLDMSFQHQAYTLRCSSVSGPRAMVRVMSVVPS